MHLGRCSIYPTLQSSQKTSNYSLHPPSFSSTGLELDLSALVIVMEDMKKEEESLLQHDLLVIGFGLHSREGGGWRDLAAVDAFLEQFDDDAPGGPGVADFAGTAERLVEFEEGVDDGRHAEDGHLPSPSLLHHPHQQLLEEVDQVVGTLTGLVGLSVEYYYLLQVLLRVLLPHQSPQQSQQHFLALHGYSCVVGHGLVVVVLLDLVLLVLTSPITDPIYKLPDRFYNNPVQSVDVKQLAQLRLPDLTQLQEHPYEVSISLSELFDLYQEEVVVELPPLTVFASLISFRVEEGAEFFLRGLGEGEGVLLTDVLALHLLVDAVKEVLIGRTHHRRATEEHLFEGIGELTVELHQVADLCLVLLTQSIEENRLRGNYTGVLDACTLVEVVPAGLGVNGTLGDALLLVGVAVDEERQEIRFPLLSCLGILELLVWLRWQSGFLPDGFMLLLDRLMFLLDDGFVDGSHVELRLLLIGLFEAFLPWQHVHKTGGQFFLNLGSTHFVEVAFVTHASLRTIEVVNLKALSNLLQFIPQIDGLEVAIAEDQLVKLLLVDGPHLLKSAAKVLLKHLEDVLAPAVSLLRLEPLQQLIQY